MHENEVSAKVLDAAIAVHRALGPGLLEGVYEAALAYELASRGLRVERQVPIAATYRGVRLGEAFRADLVVQDVVVVELKAVEALSDVHRQQALTYVRLSKRRLGLLVNFGGARLKDGFERIANGIDS